MYNSRNSNPAVGIAGLAAELVLFLIASRRDVKPRGSVFLEVVPFFSGMVFWCFGGREEQQVQQKEQQSSSRNSRSSS